MRFLAERIGDGFWRERGPRLRPSRVVTDFLRQSHYPGPLQAAVRVTALDARQVTLGTALFQDGACVGLQSTRLHARIHGEEAALPAGWQSALDSPVPAPASEPSPAEPAAITCEAYPLQRQLDTRYNDLDATGRIGEGAWMRGAETGRSALLQAAFAALGGDGARATVGLLVARVDLHLFAWRAQPSRWRLGAGVTHQGRSSVVVRVGFFDEQPQAVACADCVLVFVDRERGQPLTMPEPVRAALDAQRVRIGAGCGHG
jgi:acyl-CoA thioesterase FadM